MINQKTIVSVLLTVGLLTIVAQTANAQLVPLTKGSPLFVNLTGIHSAFDLIHKTPNFCWDKNSFVGKKILTGNNQKAMRYVCP